MKSLRYTAKITLLCFCMGVAMPVNTGCEYAALIQALLPVLQSLMQAYVASENGDVDAEGQAYVNAASGLLNGGGAAISQMASQNNNSNSNSNSSNGGSADEPDADAGGGGDSVTEDPANSEVFGGGAGGGADNDGTSPEDNP